MHEVLETKYAEYIAMRDFLSDPSSPGKPNYVSTLKKWGAMQKFSAPLLDLKKAEQDYNDAQSIINDATADPELKELAQSEIDSLQKTMDALIDTLETHLVSMSEDSGRNVMIEIRIGVGGAESALFVGDLFEIYRRYIEEKKWKMDILEMDPAEQGGFREVVFMVKHPDAADRFRFEGGTHRVQRVPKTEAQGRVHTSAVTVAVMPEPEDIDIVIPESDLEVTVMRSSGPGGQSVNKTDSAVRIVHLPSGIFVKCQIEKSQLQNRKLALQMLRAKLYELEKTKRDAEERDRRQSQMGSGDRSERIRTYNYPQNRVTDHRLEGDSKNYSLDEVQRGKLDSIIDELVSSAKLKSSLKRMS